MCYTLVLTPEERRALDSLDRRFAWGQIADVLFRRNNGVLWSHWTHPHKDIDVLLGDDDLQYILELADSVNFEWPDVFDVPLVERLSNLMLQKV